MTARTALALSSAAVVVAGMGAVVLYRHARAAITAPLGIDWKG